MAIAAAIVAAAVCLSLPGSLAATAGSTAITVALPRSDAAVPFELALQRHLFRGAGLTVKLDFVDSTAQALAAVRSGRAEFGVGDPATLMVDAVDEALPLELVSGVTTTRRGLTGLLVTTASDISNAAGTYGRRVGVPELDGLDRLATQVWLDENGSDTNAVTFVQVASSNARRALARGYVDAVLVDQPELSALTASAGFRSLGDVENALLGSEAPAAVAFSTTGYLRSSAGRPASLRFVHALEQAIDVASTDRPAVASLLTSVAGWPASLAARLTPLYIAPLDTFVLDQIAETQFAYGIAGKGQPNVAALVWSQAPQESS